jgi:exopolysaccharide biosynthesis polyprenyl glycosylphosphotransferase
VVYKIPGVINGGELILKNIKYNITLRIAKSLNVLFLTVPFVLCWYGYYARQMDGETYGGESLLIIALYVVLYVIFARVYDALTVPLSKVSEMILSQVLAALISDGIIYVVIWLMMKKIPNILPGLGAVVLQILLAAVWSICMNKWYFLAVSPKKSVVIYDVRSEFENLINEYGLDKAFKVQSVMPVEDCIKDVRAIGDADTVFLSGIHSHDRNIILKYCVNHGIEVYVIPRVGDVIMSGAKKMHMFHLPMLRVERYNPSIEYLILKRLFDIVASSVAIIVSSPIMLVTAVAIKVTDGGPIFYKQIRLTKDGKEFYITKFRSMCVDAEKDGVARLSTGRNDDRITTVGRFIRRFRIDELPQLFQILQGYLSIVGPRPERPEIAAEYEKEMPEFHLRLQAKAGLTGYAQVYGKYNTTPYDKLQMDLMYIANPSICEDLKIMFATAKILFTPESTDGVETSQVTALKTKNSVAVEDDAVIKT